MTIEKLDFNATQHSVQANKACTRRWGFWRDSKPFSTPYHFSSWTASPSPPQRRYPLRGRWRKPLVAYREKRVILTQELTERETQVLKLIAEGLTNKSISHLLSITESTVENHIHKIYEKLNISNRSQATAYAYQIGLVLSKNVNESDNRGNPS